MFCNGFHTGFHKFSWLSCISVYNAIAKNFVVLDSLQHTPECRRYSNDTDDKESATVDGRKFATAPTCLAYVAHAANNANATVDQKTLTPKFNVETCVLQSALRNLRVSHDPPAVTVFTHTTLNPGARGVRM